MSAEPPGFIHVIDPSYFDPDPIEPFRLLDLPRELRDMIYEHMVVRGTVFIMLADCWKPGQKKRNGHPLSWQCDTRPVHRTAYMRTLNSDGGYYTYEGPEYTDFDHVNVSIFRANRQLYLEASAIYYKKNTFYFSNTSSCMHIVSVPACYAFLVDRTPHALRNLKSIDLLMDARGLTSTTARWLDGEFMSDLVDFINKNLALESLGLDFCGWPPDVRLSPWDWNVPDLQAWHYEVRMSWPGALLQLNSVKNLYLEVYASEGPPERLVAFLFLLRYHLLENGERLGTRNFKAYARHFGKYREESGDGDAEPYYKRKLGERKIHVYSHDDANGRSFVEPATRESPLWEGAVAKRVAKGQDIEEARKEVRANVARYTSHCAFMDAEGPDTSDYDASDDGDDDSLNSLELDEDDMDFVMDEDYIESFRDLDDRRKEDNERRYLVGAQAYPDTEAVAYRYF